MFFVWLNGKFTVILHLEKIVEMNKTLYSAMVLAIACFMLSSCFKDEPLNAEADIEQAFIHADDVDRMFYNPTDTLVNVLSSNTNIRFNVRPGTDRTSLAPQFRLTEGATVVPESGSMQDFSAGSVKYTVTSQDGQWHRDYQVSVVEKQPTVDEVSMFRFDQYALESARKKYYVWTDTTYYGQTLDCWATGNPGFALSKGSAKPDEYPTVPVTIEDAGSGNTAVKLTTRDTGAFGAMVNMRIAAGNLFLGEFDVSNALKDAMEATHFGVPVANNPISFSGRYKYKPGEKYQDKQGKEVAGVTDKANIYAVLYENTDEAGNAVVLKGDNVLTSSQLVAVALLDDINSNDEWTDFYIDFNYIKALDESRLENYGYNFAIVMTSSAEGANFEGAVGSTLTVDALRVIWKGQIKND